MRIFAMLCVRNEADRYLSDCLLWHSSIVDDLFVYDDQSSDETAELAASMGASVQVRPDEVFSFREHEGEFRQAAWSAFEFSMMPCRDDWVLALDADEFLISQSRLERRALEQLARTAELDDRNAVMLHFHEIFGEGDNGDPLVRTDGFWADTNHPRFFRYQHRGHFANRRMGGGSVPTYVNPIDAEGQVEILHYGHAVAEDRRRKYDFYNSLASHGHNQLHINSMVDGPADMTLVPWKGKTPWRA